MLKEVLSCVCSAVAARKRAVNTALIACAAAGIVAVCSDAALAQDGGMEMYVDFSSVFEDLKETVSTVVTAAIGIGLSVWAACYLFRLVKKMAR